MAFRAALFDLDGTLVDTMGDLVEATNAMRVDMGMPPLARETIMNNVGRGIDHLVMSSLNHGGRSASVDEIMRGRTRFRDHYHQVNGKHSRLFPGVRQGLEEFRAQGMRLAVVTNKLSEFTHPLLDRSGLAAYFDAVVCGDTCERRKPDPLPLYHACDLLGTSTRESLFVGDSIYDAQAGAAAGIVTLLLPYGYDEGAPVHGLQADAIVQSISEAAQWAAAHHD